MSDTLLTTKQASVYLSVSTSTLEHDRWRGAEIPFVRVGKRSVRYQKSVLDHYLQSRIRKNTIDADQLGGKS